MVNFDLFNSNNYELQREELLARIAQSLQLDATRKKRMEDAYNAISKFLNEDQGFFKNIQSDVYVQGSTAIGATCKPIKKNEFDLDIVVHIKHLFTNYTPDQIYNELVKVIENSGIYKDKIEKKKRCIRINYANDFHMDIMPGCIKLIFDDKNIKVPDRELKNWTDSNPRGYIEWFLNKSKTVAPSLLENYRKQLINLKAEVEDLPKDDFYSKTPLQRAVQLIKRYRDIYFEKNDTFATSSIVLTTLMAHFYGGETSIYNTLENTVSRIKDNYLTSLKSQQKFRVLNPLNKDEDFTDKWSSEHYAQFFAFIEDFYKEWEAIKQTFDKSATDYIILFGEGLYKQSLLDQTKQMAKFSNDKNAIASSLILGGNALTDNIGQINSSKGYRNERHHNYGE